MSAKYSYSAETENPISFEHCTGGSVNGIYTLETKEGGYLVIMDSSGNTIWSTPEKDGAWSTSSPYALLLDDGNFYLYGAAEELWKARKYKLENTQRIVHSWAINTMFLAMTTARAMVTATASASASDMENWKIDCPTKSAF